MTDLRRRFREVLERAEAGEEIVVTRRGKAIARIVPPRREPKRFPDLTEFRKSIEIRGEPISKTLIRMRRESR